MGQCGMRSGAMRRQLARNQTQLQRETLIFAWYGSLCNRGFEAMGGKRKLPGAEHGLKKEKQLHQADNLVNPVSGIAHDFLNQYNEVLLLVENLPVLLPEMIDDLLAWKPKIYHEYFASSPLPGSAAAIKLYYKLGDSFRRKFETQIAKLNKIAFNAISVIGNRHRATSALNAKDVEEFCAHISKKLRVEIEKSNWLVNHALNAPQEAPQEMADRLMHSKPRKY
jgi:hypothetical protein